MTLPESNISARLPVHSNIIGSASIPTINAEDLHCFLEVKTRYDIWIARRIATYGFQEGRDFTTFNIDQGPVRTIEYHVSMDMAKELSMVERTVKGKEARHYFLACERQVLAEQQTTIVTPAEAALALAQAVVTIERRQLAQDARQEALEATQATQAAEILALQAQRPPEGKQTLYDWLRSHRKPRLPKATFENCKEHCRRLEEPEPWTAPGRTFPEYFYSPSTLDTAYRLATRQLLLLPGGEGLTHDPSMSYRRQRKGRP